MGRSEVYEKKVETQWVARGEANAQQKWLCSVLSRANLNLAGLAVRLHLSRQSVSNWLAGRSALSFPVICAICYVTGIDDDPEKIWSAIQEDAKRKENEV